MVVARWWAGSWFPPNMTLACFAKSSTLLSSDQRIMKVQVLHGSFGKLIVGCYLLLTQELLPYGHSTSTKSLIGLLLQRNSEGLSDLRVLGLSDQASLARPALRRNWTNFIHWRMVETTVLLGRGLNFKWPKYQKPVIAVSLWDTAHGINDKKIHCKCYNKTRATSEVM